ncbi:PAS domain S-box-containing protein [Virgibacillus natechei]|uniref:PAS domain S-box-containing protein n=1 Tax=Virgibacillus natechei TaxID=1216297 RepID=A0ABS4IFK0_9BACI|nr:sigma 54-interacting transcriptional regulator [Virgibacillus natechei]MBP1969126.1 PAS domain S-box-containing protein [Virgibacillus natechei]UZD14391.1 sigma 54-interacting transcriptional regulator [Virgibacillus natechei]
MKNASNYLDAVLSMEDDAITIINQHKEVIFWNEAAVQTYNIKESDIIQEQITNFFHDDDLMVLKVLDTKKPVQGTYHRPRKDKHVVVNASPIFTTNNELIGSISVERDITQIVKLNDNLLTTSTELNELRQKVYTDTEENPFSRLKGNSLPLQQTIQLARKAAKTDATTLVLGESGTGKEIVARAIHEASPRKEGPFIPVNCGAIPEALFESELFGYEGGAFTGAERKGKTGKIEMANGGTLFLDEVAELPLDMQVKLLRVLQESIIYKVGSSSGKPINVRFIAATNQNLEQQMVEKQFRSDLFYRLNVIQLTMPPLRQRLNDVPELAKLFLKQFSVQYEVPMPTLEKDAVEALFQYQWPGNVRELRNLIERVIILSEESVIKKQDLLSFFHSSSAPSNLAETANNHSLVQEKEAMEKKRIEEALEQHNGNKTAAANQLGISRVTLYSKLRKYRI